MIDFHLGDAVQWANDYQGELFHAALMDAPYEMNFMGKGWEFVQGVEITEEYLPIARARAEYWTEKETGGERSDSVRPLIPASEGATPKPAHHLAEKEAQQQMVMAL